MWCRKSSCGSGGFAPATVRQAPCRARTAPAAVWMDGGLGPMKDHCTEEQLVALLDGELERDVAEGLRSHLARCDACNEEHNRLAALSGLLQTWQPEAGDISEKVLAAVQRAEDAGLLPALLDELRHLRTEMRGLREEITELRRAVKPENRSAAHA